ncbi:MAG: DUF5916 domain-containing protein [Gemmatimonadales bacterium]
MRHPYLFLVPLVLASASLAAQPRELAVPRIGARPAIDGRLDEPLWQNAAVLDQWVQTEPADNGPPHGATTAYLAYDQAFLYIGLRAKDHPGAIRYRLHERDNVVFQGQDWIGLALDPTNTRRRAYFIAINPIGVQGDGLSIEGSGFEEWDGVFQTAGRVSEGEYTVEIAIPFKSLRYPGGRNQRWGFSLRRSYGRDNAVDYPWARNRDLACDLCQMITLTGISDIGSTARFEVNPAVVGRLAADRPIAAGPFGPTRTEGEFGVNLKYALTSSLSLDGTWNPDFSQVEADAGQLEINNRFALFFPEKRPFFLEGSDIFLTRFGMPGQDAGFSTPPVNVFYSRRVVDPNGGLKVTGKVGRLSIGTLASIDAARDYDLTERIGGIAPGQLDPFGGTEVQVGVARARMDVFADGFVGGSLTARRFGSGLGTVASVDGRFRIGRNTTFRALAARSRTEEPDVVGRVRRVLGAALADPLAIDRAIDSLPAEARVLDAETRTGGVIQTSIEYDDRHWNFGAGYLDITPDFETHLGFTPRTDYALFTSYLTYTRQSTGFLRQLRGQVRTEHGYQHDAGGAIGELGARTDRLVSGSVDFTLPSATSVSFGLTSAALRVEDVPFDGLVRGFAWLSTQAFRGFDISMFVRAGEEAIFANVVEGGPPSPSFFTSGSINLNLRPRANIRLGLDVSAARVWRRTATEARASRYAESAIPRLKAQIQLSKQLGVRLIGEYRFESFFDRQGLVAREREVFATDALVTFLVHPGQSIQAGWSTRAAGDQLEPFRTVARGGVAKVTYLWRF